MKKLIVTAKGQHSHGFPFNYKRVKRLSRESGKSFEEVETLLHKIWKELRPGNRSLLDSKETELAKSIQDMEAIRHLYRRATVELGLDNSPLTNKKSNRPSSEDAAIRRSLHDDQNSLTVHPDTETDFDYGDHDRLTVLATVQGFNDETARDYLISLGYPKSLIETLRDYNGDFGDIGYPSSLQAEHKSAFNRYCSKMLRHGSYKEHGSLVQIASVMARFITGLVVRGVNPFRPEVLNRQKVLDIALAGVMLRKALKKLQRKERAQYPFFSGVEAPKLAVCLRNRRPDGSVNLEFFLTYRVPLKSVNIKDSVGKKNEVIRTQSVRIVRDQGFIPNNKQFGVFNYTITFLRPVMVNWCTETGGWGRIFDVLQNQISIPSLQAYPIFGRSVKPKRTN